MPVNKTSAVHDHSNSINESIGERLRHFVSSLEEWLRETKPIGEITIYLISFVEVK
jgi:hypothetical protein